MDRFRQTDGKATGWDRSIVSVGLVESRKGSSATGGEHRMPTLILAKCRRWSSKRERIRWRLWHGKVRRSLGLIAETIVTVDAGTYVKPPRGRTF
jgi:hypothetical protein